MKNLSVGKKIMAAFAIIILLIAIMLGMTMVTSMTNINNLNRIAHMNDLQNDANYLMHIFSLARVEMRTLFTSIDAEEEYNLALEYLDSCELKLEDLKRISDELDGHMADEIVRLGEMFAVLRRAVLAIGENDETTMAAIANMRDRNALMVSTGGDVFDLMLERTLEYAEAEDASAEVAIQDALIPAKLLVDYIYQMRVISQQVILQQNMDSLPELNESLELVEKQAAAVDSIATSQDVQLAVDTLSTAIQDFRDSVDTAEKLFATSETEIAGARSIFSELNELITDNVSQISVEMQNLMDNSTKTSMGSIYIMAGIGVISVVFSLFVAIFLGRVITRPLNLMKKVMLQAGTTGNLTFDQEEKEKVIKEATAKDEIGQSLAAFAGFIDHLEYMVEVLQRIANKDLTVDVKLLGETDTMGVSLKSMTDSLNEVFSEINNASSQVSVAANEIAMGAQSLAQGSTEQAATVEEISASVAEINVQVNQSSDTVSEAAKRSLEINEVAAEGNRKMEGLTSSMRDINEASQAIGRVIKAIDDIAFQTNILALNAAVEAARAGAHGRGFSVVAEEVRNLASKSAEAAKETSVLISTNIEKAEQGLTYVEDTANSLAQIVEGIQKNSDSLNNIVLQNQGVQSATKEVSTAIDQVAQVAQQNSATSEQSASASEQLSGQAGILKQMVAQFELKKQDSFKPESIHEALPSYSENSYSIGGKY